MWDPYAEFETAVMQNGITVHAAHWPNRQWQAMGFVINSGAEQDPPGLEGLAHFVEHVICENAIVPRSSIDALFEDCGGGVNLGATGFPFTKWSFFVPIDKEILAKAFSIFGHMLLSCQLEKFIERERRVILAEFNRSFKAKELIELGWRQRRALYKDTFLERFLSPLGIPESLERIGQTDLQSFYDGHYNPANMHVVGVGGMTVGELANLLFQSPFGINKRGERTPLPKKFSDISPLLETHYVFEASKYSTLSVNVGAYESKTKIPASINFWVIRILRDMFREVLYEELRERRSWTYSATASVYNFRQFYEFSIECKSFELEALDEIEGVIEVCIASIGDREDLFDQTKLRVVADNLLIDANGREIRNGAMDAVANRHRVVSLDEYDEDIRKITMTDIRAALRWLTPEMRYTMILKP